MPRSSVARTRVQPLDVVLQSRGRAAKAPRQARHLLDAAFDDERLARQLYLTLAEVAHLYRKPSANAARMWLKRVVKVQTFDNGRLARRRDIEDALQQLADEGARGVSRHAPQSRHTRPAALGVGASR